MHLLSHLTSQHTNSSSSISPPPICSLLSLPPLGHLLTHFPAGCRPHAGVFALCGLWLGLQCCPGTSGICFLMIPVSEPAEHECCSLDVPHSLLSLGPFSLGPFSSGWRGGTRALTLWRDGATSESPECDTQAAGSAMLILSCYFIVLGKFKLFSTVLKNINSQP